MAAGGVVGAAFGEGFAILHDTVKHVVGKIIMFKSILKSLESTLDGIAPVVQEIGRLSLALDHPDKETKRLIEQMEKGKELVLKCSKIKRWSWNYYFKAYFYAKKLKKLNNAIEKFCQIDLTVQNRRTALETLIKVNQTTTTVLETAAKMDLVLEEVTELKKKKSGFRTLSCAASRPRDYIVGLELPLKELKQLLSNKEVSLLLLTALGGCGKTTLVKMLCWDEDIKGIYGENVFFVKVSQAPNLKVMVQKLFKHNDEECPEFQSDEEAIDQLEQLLNEIGQKQPILLILDDVWPGSESLIEKFKFDIPAYKIVVTSRTAFPRFRYRYNLNPLNPVDAMSLFCYSASLQDQDESSYIPEEYIEKLVSGCGGLPIALKVIGGSLRGHPAGVWLSTLTKWSEGHSIFDSDAEVLDCLQKSLEFSADKTILKEYFMDLGSFPEDQRISATALIDLWTELHEPSENDVHAMLLNIQNLFIILLYMLEH